MSMAHSLESQVPLLDHPLAEFAATIPADWKLRGSRTKYIFVRALRWLVPDATLDRPKKGFGVPLGRCSEGRFAPWFVSCHLRIPSGDGASLMRRGWNNCSIGTIAVTRSTNSYGC